VPRATAARVPPAALSVARHLPGPSGAGVQPCRALSAGGEGGAAVTAAAFLGATAVWAGPGGASGRLRGRSAVALALFAGPSAAGAA